MDVTRYLLSCVALVATLAVCGAMSIPSRGGDTGLEGNQLSEDSGSELSAGDLKQQFVDLVDMAIHQLAAEGKINPYVLAEDSEVEDLDTGVKEKRGRFQGFCFRKTNTGRFLPYVCWKQDKRRR